MVSLTDLLKSKVQLVWSSQAQYTFDRVKALMCSSPVLAAPQFDSLLTVQVDASHAGAGALSLQEDDVGVERTVGFLFKKVKNRLSIHIRGTTPLLRERLWGLQHFDVCVGSGTPLVVYTDHKRQTILYSLQNPGHLMPAI